MRLQAVAEVEAPPSLAPSEGSLDLGLATFVVEGTGTLTTVQDAGRPGHAHLGVPRAGPADAVSHALANRLVGNHPGAAALELVSRGPRLRALRATHVAVVGARPRVVLDGLEVTARAVVPVAAGQCLEVVSVEGGLRSYLAVGGGVAAPAVLGSCATDSLSGLGPGPLEERAVVRVGEPPASLGGHLSPDAPAPGATPRLRVLPGPHASWFPPGAFAALAERRFVVDPASNRVGLRLTPETGPLRRRPGEMRSVAVVEGSVQVPPDGCPVVLGRDHATHGGYPVLAVVATADRSALGQLRPGDEVALVPTSFGEAAAARRRLRRAENEAVVGRYPARAG